MFWVDNHRVLIDAADKHDRMCKQANLKNYRTIIAYSALLCKQLNHKKMFGALFAVQGNITILQYKFNKGIIMMK